MIVPIADLRPGMRVAKDVVDETSTVLLTKGTELDAGHLRSLARRGIEAVQILEEKEKEAPAPPAMLTLAEQMVAFKFRLIKPGPDTDPWRDLAIQRMAGVLSNDPLPSHDSLQLGGEAKPSQEEKQSPNPCPTPREFINKRVGTLPTLPSIYYSLVQTIQDPNASVDRVIGLIRLDQSLTTRILKLANSAFYGFNFKVETVEEAAQLIGLAEIQIVVLASSVIRAFHKIPPHLVNVLSFWQHSIACGAASSMLAERGGALQPERHFVGGLLHELGRLLLFLHAPKQSRLIMELSEKEGAESSAMEKRVMQFDHAELGAELAQVWKLPAIFSQMVGRHHAPNKSTASEDVFFVHYADWIVSALGLGNGGERVLSPLIVPPGCERFLVAPEDCQTFSAELTDYGEQMFPIFTS